MTPGFAQPRSKLPWLPYESLDRVIINSHNFTQSFDPAQLTLSLWMDASDATTITQSSGLISAVNDKSGNSRNGSASGAARPQYITAGQNGLNTIEFAVNEILTLASNANSAAGISYALVLQRPVSGNISPLIGSMVSYAYLQYANLWALGNEVGTVVFPTTWNISVGTTAKNGTGANRHINGAFPVSTTGSDTTTDLNTINSAFSTTLWNLGELLFAREVWSTDTRQKVEGYLAHKWGLTGNLPSGHPYKSVAP